MKVIRYGFDTIDISFQGALPQKALDMLEGAKEQAQATGRDQLVNFGGIMGHVKETGKRGGYRFTFDTGPESCIWWFKANTNHQQHNIFVSIRAAALAINGWRGMRDEVYSQLEKFGATVIEASLNRLDFAVDILAPDFVLRPENFIAAWQTKKSVHNVYVGDGDRAEHIHYIGRKCGGVTLGKMPGRQVIIYDKRREVIDARGKKDFWWDAWGLDKADPKNQVWRVELRAGKKHLKDMWDLSTWEEFEASILDVFKDAVEAIRYVQPTDDSNASRWPNHEIWGLVSGTVEGALSEHESGLVKGRVMSISRAQARATYANLIKGLMAGYSVAVGEHDPTALSEILAQIVKDEAGSKEFQRKKMRASERLFFIDGALHDNHQPTGQHGRLVRRYRPHADAGQPGQAEIPI